MSSQLESKPHQQDLPVYERITIPDVGFCKAGIKREDSGITEVVKEFLDAQQQMLNTLEAEKAKVEEIKNNPFLSSDKQSSAKSVFPPAHKANSQENGSSAETVNDEELAKLESELSGGAMSNLLKNVGKRLRAWMSGVDEYLKR